MVARQDRRMTRAGLCQRVTLIAIAEHRPRREARHALGEMRSIFVEQVRRELIDRNDDEELRRCWRSRSAEQGGCHCNDQFAHAPPCTPAKAGVQPKKKTALLAPPGPRPSPGYSQPSFARSRSLTTCGLALPAIAFIAWPTKKPNSACLPPLYSTTLSALSARILSIASSIAPVSLVCFKPRLSTIARAPSPLSSMISNTCLAMVPLIVPSATRPSSSAAAAGVTGLFSIASPRRLSAPNNSPTTQLPACLGSAPAASKASNQRAVSTSAVSTLAL